MRIAAKVHLEKDKYPERFCPDKQCLWRVWTRSGAKPCPKHMRERFANPAICEGCGYPLTNHPRMGCALVEGRMA